MISSSVGGLAGSRSKTTAALSQPPTDRVRTGYKVWLWTVGVEPRRSLSPAGDCEGMVDVVVVVVEARRGGAGTKGAYALAYAVVRRWPIESMGFQGSATGIVFDLCWHTRTVSGRAVGAGGDGRWR